VDIDSLGDLRDDRLVGLLSSSLSDHALIKAAVAVLTRRATKAQDIAAPSSSIIPMLRVLRQYAPVDFVLSWGVVTFLGCACSGSNEKRTATCAEIIYAFGGIYILADAVQSVQGCAGTAEEPVLPSFVGTCCSIISTVVVLHPLRPLAMQARCLQRLISGISTVRLADADHALMATLAVSSSDGFQR